VACGFGGREGGEGGWGGGRKLGGGGGGPGGGVGLPVPGSGGGPKKSSKPTSLRQALEHRDEIAQWWGGGGVGARWLCGDNKPLFGGNVPG